MSEILQQILVGAAVVGAALLLGRRAFTTLRPHTTKPACDKCQCDSSGADVAVNAGEGLQDVRKQAVD